MPEDFCARQPFDFVVVGGGTAGLAVAACLAAVETGSAVGSGPGADPDEAADVDIPGRYGRALGGSSALNFMAWNRATAADYDAWAALGNAGWGWRDLLPFKKSESFHAPADAARAQLSLPDAAGLFGSGGPIHVSYDADVAPSHGPWLGALDALGLPTNRTHVGGSNVGAWTGVNAVDPRTGRRSYAPSYCSPAPDNLHILTETTARGIVLTPDGGWFRATGVRFASAGAVQSPQLLELSGIGGPEVLARAGAPLKVRSLRVGENLQDHMSESETPPEAR